MFSLKLDENLETCSSLHSSRRDLVEEESSLGLLSTQDYEFQSGRTALRDADFFLMMRDSFLAGMEKVLGKAGVESTFYHLELTTCVETPVKFHTRLSSMYRSGTSLLESAILTELFRRIGLSFRMRKGCSYPDYVYEAGRVFLIQKSDRNSN